MEGAGRVRMGRREPSTLSDALAMTPALGTILACRIRRALLRKGSELGVELDADVGHDLGSSSLGHADNLEGIPRTKLT